jgi:hypothetical protein
MIKMLKYVIGTANIPVLFSINIFHNTVMDECLSAGYLLLRYNECTNSWFVVSCFGESTTLNIKSNPIADKLLIEIFLKQHVKNTSRLFIEYLDGPDNLK